MVAVSILVLFFKIWKAHFKNKKKSIHVKDIHLFFEEWKKLMYWIGIYWIAMELCSKYYVAFLQASMSTKEADLWTWEACIVPISFGLLWSHIHHYTYFMSCRVHSFKNKMSTSRNLHCAWNSSLLNLYYHFTTFPSNNQVLWEEHSRLLANMQTASHVDCYCILLKFQSCRAPCIYMKCSTLNSVHMLI